MRQSSRKVGKYGKVLLTRQERDGRHMFQVAWCGPDGRYVRKFLAERTEAGAKREAQRLSAEMLGAMGFYVPSQYAPSGISVADALRETVEASDKNYYGVQGALHTVKRFLGFLEQRHPQVRQWAEITPLIIDEYVLRCREEGIAFGTLRQRLAIVRTCGKRMFRLHSIKDPTAGLRLKREQDQWTEEEDCYLEAKQLKTLLAWLRDREPMLHVWASLQGMAGLRIYEAAYMRVDDVDFEASTVRIASSPAHQVKTASSVRTLPVCPYVMDALRDWIEKNTVHPNGYLFWSERARYGRSRAKDPATRDGSFCTNYVSLLWRQALRSSDAPALPKAFLPRKLRGTFATLMGEHGTDHFVLATYMGHTPQTILGRHYQRIKIESLRQIAQIAQTFIDES